MAKPAVPNKLMGKMQPMTKGEPMASPMMSKPFTQKGGKMKMTGLGRKAKKVAEEVPVGPMKGIR